MMSDQYQAGDDMPEKRPVPDASDARREDDDEEWVDEAEELGAEEEWVEDRGSDWEEEQSADAGKPKPKEAPAYTTWIAGAIGLILGLYAFRSCG